MRELSPEEVNQILLHELAHLTRWDDWTILGKPVKSVEDAQGGPPVKGSVLNVDFEMFFSQDNIVEDNTISPRDKGISRRLCHLLISHKYSLSNNWKNLQKSAIFQQFLTLSGSSMRLGVACGSFNA